MAHDQDPRTIPVRGVPGPGTNVINFGHLFEDTVMETLCKFAGNDQFTVDYGMVAVPTGPGQMGSGYMITLTLPSPIVGKPPYSTAGFLPEQPEMSKVHDQVRALIRELRAKRFRELHIPNGTLPGGSA